MYMYIYLSTYLSNYLGLTRGKNTHGTDVCTVRLTLALSDQLRLFVTSIVGLATYTANTR